MSRRSSGNFLACMVPLPLIQIIPVQCNVEEQLSAAHLEFLGP